MAHRSNHLRSRRLLCALATTLLALLLAARAAAADAAAEALFQEAVALMKRGEFGAACPKLEASQRREPRSGTLLNLAACNEQLGKTATAWALYKDSAALARSENRRRHADKAEQLGTALEGRLSRLRIELVRVPGETITLDGTPLDEGALGAAVPLDPGKHAVAASAPGHGSWSQELLVDGEGDVTVSIPELIPRQVGAPALAVEPSTPGAATEPSAGATPPRDGMRVPTMAWVASGAGVVLIGASVLFRLDQTDAASALDENCGADRTSCEPGYDYRADYEREKRDFALFVGLGAAGVASLAVGTYMMVTSLREKPRAASARAGVRPMFSAGPSRAFAGVQGAF